jgi:hypothetical protein
MELPKTKEELYNTYYLKEYLVKICKENNLPTNGSKQNLLEYIGNFIENKPIVKIKTESRIKTNDFEPSLDKIIDINYSNNETHRFFFKRQIGEHFKYNVQFMNWMEENKGKETYRKAIEIYNKILLDKKMGEKTIIGKQFEYNQYTRDFFEDNPGLSREDCIKCWNYKKKRKGKHKYSKEDLIKICKENNLPANGSKQNLLGYIGNFIEKKPIVKIKTEPRIKTNDLNHHWIK